MKMEKKQCIKCNFFLLLKEFKVNSCIGQLTAAQSVWTTAKSQGNKPSVNTEDKDYDAKIVLEVNIVSTTREDHIAKIVMGVRFVNTKSKDRIVTIVAEVRFVSTRR